MNKLFRKTFITIFVILSSFLLLSLIIINVINYQREYMSVERHLLFDRNINFNNESNKNNDKDKKIIPQQLPKEVDNMMFMDYDVYTVKITDGNIERIINHGIQSNDLDVENISNKIIKNNDKDKVHVGNLYFSHYAYSYKLNSNITIVNLKNSNKKLLILLLESILCLLIAEILIYFISNLITKWVTKPAVDAFNKQKDFIADASHELKTPLAVIMASSDELKSDKKNSKYIDNIKYETDRMSTLISSMLDLSKLENGVTIGTYKEENISKIIEKTCLTFEALAYEHKLTIDTDIEESIMFNCSKSEIEKLISIIIDNAIKHANKNTTINVNVKKNKDNININIINEGDPIKEEDREKIFERFYRIDKARNRSENRYGLGLAIAKSIVVNHHGTIKAHSEDNKTIFTINFKK